jgi:RNase P subunit RPR2
MYFDFPCRQCKRPVNTDVEASKPVTSIVGQPADLREYEVACPDCGFINRVAVKEPAEGKAAPRQQHEREFDQEEEPEES